MFTLDFVASSIELDGDCEGRTVRLAIHSSYSLPLVPEQGG